MKKRVGEVGIVGGGLAGLTAGIILARRGVEVSLWEKNPWPHHKVCGEYVSNEVLPLLSQLGLDPFSRGALAIDRFMLSSPSGRTLEARLPLGGFGISRYALDQELSLLGEKAGLRVYPETPVEKIHRTSSGFQLEMRNREKAEVAVLIGAYGKRSSLDRRLERPFFKKSSPFLAVKRHFSGAFPEDLVALHNFRGGYCGVSRIENGLVNICYLTTQEYLKKAGSLQALDEMVFAGNPHLEELGRGLSPAWEKPLTISQIWFRPKSPLEQGILMAGDTAGLIYPLCGNGMAMAIHAGKLAAEAVLPFLEGKYSRADMESVYRKAWERTFSRRLLYGRFFQPFMGSVAATEAAVRLLEWLPGLLPPLIKQTHGKPIPLEDEYA
jgi:flavin-dependent dehydrogenase